MTRLTLLFTFALLAGCATAAPPRHDVPPHLQPENAWVTGTLEVQVTGIPSVQGQLYVELYDRDSYFDYARVLNERIVPVTDTAMAVTLEHVPPGRYIAVVSHDPNSNDRLDTGAFGVPVEAYGFSRGARGLFGPPDFEAGAFDFSGDHGTVEVALR